MTKAKVLDGKELATKLRLKMKEQVAQMDQTPVLAVVMVGENDASKIYVRNKKKAAEEVGIICEVYEFSVFHLVEVDDLSETAKIEIMEV